MLQLIDDETASRYYNEIDTATGDDLQTKMSALESWATDKKAKQHRQEWDQVSGVFTDFDNYSASEGLNDLDEESRYQYANRQFIAHQTGGKFEDQMFVYPSKRDEVTDQMFGKTGVSEKEAFNLFKGAVESRKASEEALRELPGVLAQGVLKSAGEGKQFDEVDSWFAFDGWKQRHADKLGAMPAGWETAMLDSAVKLHARTEALMADVAPESKRAMDVLMKFTRPEDAESLPDADRSDVENLAKDFAKLTPEQRDGIYATLSYAAEADGAGMGKGFWEKVGEGVARGGVNIYDDAAMTAEDRQARQNISFFQDLLDKPQAEPDRMQTADSIQMQRDMAQKGLEENKQRLGELRVMREIRDLAQGRIDPIKTEMDGVLGSVVQGAYDFSQSAAYTGMAMVPYVGLPAVMGALANSNYLRMLDQYPDMDADAAYNLSLAIAGPQAIAERIQAGLLLGKLPFLGKAMKRLTDARVPLPVRIGLGFGAVVGLETGTELIQEAMPVVADQLAAAVREDMPEFDSEKAWGQYREQAPKIFYSMLWGGLIGGGAVGIRELERSGIYLRNLQELEMHGITGKTAEDIAAEQDKETATAMFREAWDKRSPEDIQAGIRKRAAMLDAAQATQANPDLPTRRVVENPDGTTTHIIEQNGQTIYSTNDPAAADLALVNFTRMVDRGRITGTTNGIVEALTFFNQVNEAANRGDDVQKFILENTPRNLLDEYEANPTEQNLDNLFKTVRTIGQDISEPAELANFPVLASNQGALAEGIFKSVIRIYEGATGDKVVRDVAQDNLKRAIAEGRIKMEWVRENLNQIIPQIESERISQKLRTETDTDVIESFSDVALAYMRGHIRDEQIPAGLRGFLRRMAIVVKDIFRRAYKLKRLVAEGKVDANFESLLADSVGLNQQARVDAASSRVSKDIITDGGQILMDFSIGSRTSAVSTDTPSVRTSNATITGPANYSIGAFHGTPHKVDKFTTAKIGTGEGAQAYGWGLYFAEKKPVAQGYRRVGATQADIVLSNGNQVKMEDLPTPLQNALAANLEAPNPLANAKNFLTGFSGDYYRKNSFGDKAVDDSIAKLDEIIQAGGNVKNVGNLYTAELDVEPEDLLDWDKPISEQSPKVKAALQSVSDNWLWQDAISGKGGEQVGGALYSTLRATFPDAEFSRDGVDASKKASEALLAAGIPGIRYLDGGSRGSNSSIWQDGSQWAVTYADPAAGQSTTKRFVTQAEAKAFDDSLDRTYNYVAFDENLIRITEENGQPVTMQQAQAGNVSTDTSATNYSIGFAPNGNPSNLTPEDQALAMSPEFKQWGGNWEVLAEDAAWKKAVEDYYSNPNQREPLKIGRVPSVLRAVGVSDAPMVMPPSVIHKVTVKKHTLTREMVEQIPSALRDPIFVFNSATEPNSVTILTDIRHQGKNVVAAIHLDRPAPRKPANLVVSLHDRPASQIENWIKDGLILYANQGKARAYFRSARLQLPREGSKAGNQKLLTEADVVNRSVNPESISVKTDENGEPLASEIARFRQETGTSNYSISSQSEIDRVNRALGGMNRGPDARIAVYERAKQKFSTLIQNNQQALDNLRAGTVSFRRTQLLQALGELDAILSIFPPDLRGRVGGYTRLASIAPHDVFKDGEKVSEVSGMKGAIISAWMKEGQNIGQAGKQTELPPGYTAKENLSTARADRAIADFFKQRIEMIDRELEKTLRKEYDEAFRKLLDRTKPKKAAPGEKPKGIGGDIQDLFAVVRDSVDMSATDVAAHIAGSDAKIASGELTAEQEAREQIEAALVALTGDWKNADADRRRTALMEATRIWNGAYAAHTQKVIQQRQDREVARVEAIAATGKAGDLPGRKSKAIADSGLKGSWKDYILNLLNFDQVVGVLFGENTEVANTIIDKQRRAENAKEDGSQAKMQELEDFFTGLAGGNVLAGERLRYRLAQPSMTVNGIKMSELEALSAAMMWAQEDGRRHMEGEMDELGKPAGAWHYDQAFVDEILANLSTEALALRDWLGQRYADEYANINAVYSELNGINLPQIRNYSPVTVQPVNAPTGQVLDPVSGSAMSGAGTSPGALRTRGTSIAEPRFQDVLQTYISHTLQMEHWKAFAPMIAEANGILRNRDVQNSVEEKGGAEARTMLNLWLDYFAQGGNRDAGAHLALNKGLNNVLGRASQVALVGRASTLLIQSTQLGAALAEMPLKAYLKRMGKLLTGQLGWDAALNSDYIQRRVKQMPPVVQMAMQGLKGAKPTAIQQAGKRLGMLLSGADGLFTAGTYAITYDYHLTKAKELGLAGQEAEDYARNTAERVTDRIAQPTRAGARSLFENTQTAPLARAGWAFASEARKNLALVAYSFAQRDTATKLQTIAYVLALNAIGSQILRSIWRDILDDDDDELFDEKYWNPQRFLMAAATEPLYGMPVFGPMLEEAVYKSAGEYNQQRSLFSVSGAVGPIKRLPDHLSGDTDMREVMRDIDMVVSSLGIMHPNIAATSSITHLAKDLFNLGDSAVDATTED